MRTPLTEEPAQVARLCPSTGKIRDRELQRPQVPRGLALSKAFQDAPHLTELGVEVALRHLGHVIFVQELTLVPFLAQSSQPVFAHNCLLTTDVAEWAHAPCQKSEERYRLRWKWTQGKLENCRPILL